MNVNEANKQLTFDAINSKGILPQARSNHCINNVCDRFVLLTGGETAQIDQNKKI